MVLDVPLPPVVSTIVILPLGNKLALFVLTDTVNDAPESSSVGATITVILSPSSDTAEGSDIGSNTGVSFVLVTVRVNV